MSALPVDPRDLTLDEAWATIDAAIKSKAYQTQTALGPFVKDYIQWKRSEWGATPLTILDYEAILARLCLYSPDLSLADYEPPAGTDRLRACWDFYWGTKAGRTRAKVRSVWVDFFEWAADERAMTGNPARRLRSPKKRDVEVRVFTPQFVQRVVEGQAYLPDALATRLILTYALRKGSVAACQVKHFNYARRTLTAFAKGGRIYYPPIVEDSFWNDLEMAKLEYGLGPESYLVNWRTDTRKRKVPLAEATEILDLANGKQQGYAWLTKRYHDRKPSPKRMHLWWYGCLANAGLVKKGTTSGSNMHRGRHTSVTELLRSSGNLSLAGKLAGHKDIRTTQQYEHLLTADLAAALREMLED